MTCYHPVESLYDPVKRKLLYGREKLIDANIDELHDLGFRYRDYLSN